MRFVLDSCVGFKWLVAEIDSDKALRLREDFRNGVVDLLAPDIYPVEIVHSLTRAERQGRVTPVQGRTLLQDMLTHLPTLHPYLSLLPRAYVLSSRARMGVYDCLYVALAEQEGCQVVTADDKMKRNLPNAPILLLSTF